MLKSNRKLSAQMTRHEEELAILKAHHERMLKDATLRASSLVAAGLFTRADDGSLLVAKPYSKVIIPK